MSNSSLPFKYQGFQPYSSDQTSIDDNFNREQPSRIVHPYLNNTHLQHPLLLQGASFVSMDQDDLIMSAYYGPSGAIGSNSFHGDDLMDPEAFSVAAAAGHSTDMSLLNINDFFPQDSMVNRDVSWSPTTPPLEFTDHPYTFTYDPAFTNIQALDPATAMAMGVAVSSNDMHLSPLQGQSTHGLDLDLDLDLDATPNFGTSNSSGSGTATGFINTDLTNFATSPASPTPSINSISSITTPTETKKFQCLEAGCGRSYTTDKSLKQHIFLKHNQARFECVSCLARFGCMGEFGRHFKTNCARGQQIIRAEFPMEECWYRCVLCPPASISSSSSSSSSSVPSSSSSTTSSSPVVPSPTTPTSPSTSTRTWNREDQLWDHMRREHKDDPMVPIGVKSEAREQYLSKYCRHVTNTNMAKFALLAEAGRKVEPMAGENGEK